GARREQRELFCAEAALGHPSIRAQRVQLRTAERFGNASLQDRAVRRIERRRRADFREPGRYSGCCPTAYPADQLSPRSPVRNLRYRTELLRAGPLDCVAPLQPRSGDARRIAGSLRGVSRSTAGGTGLESVTRP